MLNPTIVCDKPSPSKKPNWFGKFGCRLNVGFSHGSLFRTRFGPHTFSSNVDSPITGFSPIRNQVQERLIYASNAVSNLGYGARLRNALAYPTSAHALCNAEEAMSLHIPATIGPVRHGRIRWDTRWAALASMWCPHLMGCRDSAPAIHHAATAISLFLLQIVTGTVSRI